MHAHTQLNISEQTDSKTILVSGIFPFEKTKFNLYDIKLSENLFLLLIF